MYILLIYLMSSLLMETCVMVISYLFAQHCDIRLLKRLASKNLFSIGTVYLNVCKIYDLLYLPIHVIVIRDWMY